MMHHEAKGYLLYNMQHALWAYWDAESNVIFEEVRSKNFTLTRNYGFSYKGVLYYTKKYSDRLDESLLETFEKWRAAKNRVDNHEKPMVMGYLRAVLNISNNPNDWIKYVNAFFHPIIEGGLTLSMYTASVVTVEEIEAFNKKYEKSLDLLGERLAYNFIKKFTKP